MNNNEALSYLIVTRIKSVVRNFVKKPIQAILSGIVLLAILGLLYFLSTRETVVPDGVLAKDGFLLIIGSMPLLILLIFVFNKQTALLYLNDANYLFVGPFSSVQVKNYLVITSLQQMVAIGFGAVIYFGLFFNFLIWDSRMLWKAFLFLSLTILLALMYFNYYYIVNASKEEPSRINRWLPVLSMVMLLIVLIVSNYGRFDVGVMRLFEKMVSHPWFQFVPFVGWANAVQNNNFWVGYGIPLVLSLIYIALFYRFDGDYYEKATEDAARVSAIKSKMMTSKNNQDTLEGLKDSKKLSKIKKYTFSSGGWALFSRQLLQLIKTRQLLSMNQIMIMVIYTIISIVSGDADMFKGMMVISLLFTMNTDSIESELKRHFIYLIPDSDFKKMVATLSVRFIQSGIYVLFASLVLILAFSEPLLDALYFSMNLWIVSFLYLSILVLSMRFIGFSKNQLLKLLVTTGLYLVALVPTGLVVFILYLMNAFSLEVLTIANSVVNGLLGVIFLMVGSAVVSGKGIVD